MLSGIGNVQPAPPMRGVVPEGRRRTEAAVFLLIALAIGWFYVWSARPEDASWRFGERQTDYYNLLVDGMLKGQLNLDVEVPADLLAVKDPYDPAQRPPGVALHDASLYAGKYYLYFGAAPVVVLLLPFRLITHTALPLPVAVVVFAYAGFLACGMTWWLVRRRYFPEASTFLSAFLLLALGTVSMVPVLVRRPNIWELPLAAGYCFAAIAVLCVYASFHAERRAAWWFAAAGLMLGLAVASRPTYLFGAGLLLVPLLFMRRTRWFRGGRRSAARAALTVQRSPETPALRYALAGLVPFVAVGLALAAYNYARFGNPLEFGQSYQLSGMYEGHEQHFRWAYFPHNVRLYGFAPFAWSVYFPFIHAMKMATGPSGYVGVEEVCGVLLHMPLLWLTLLVPLAVTRAAGPSSRPLRAWLVATAALALGMLVTLGFFSAVARYEVDFVPWFLLLACIGGLAAERAVRPGPRWSRQIVVLGLVVTSLASAAFGVLFSLVVYGNFQRSSPDAYAALAHVMDYPAYWLRRVRGNDSGAVEMTVRFPGRPAAHREPLLRTGWYRAADHVFVEYGTDGRIRFGFAHNGGGLFFSRWLGVSSSSDHHLRVELGSLYPPEEDPVYDRVPAAMVARVTRRVLVELDNDVLIDRYYRFEAVAPGRFEVGEERDDAGFGTRFSGQILTVLCDSDHAHAHGAGSEPLRGEEVAGPAEFDRMTLKVRLPARRPVGVREPLVITGVTGGADFLYIEYLDDRRVRFGLEHWGKPGLLSTPIDWPETAARTVEAALGSFPAPGFARAARDRVTVRIDGALVWTAPARFYIADGADVFIARNPLGGTACVPRFSGTVSDVKRLSGE